MRDLRPARRAMAAGVAGFVLLLPMLAGARSHGDGEDRVAIFSTITVKEESPAADVVCAFCTVHLNGDVHGDVAAIFSTVEVGEDRTISGDVATLFSTLRVGDGAHIAGDLATAFGTASLAPTAHVDGDRAMWASGLGLTVALAPLLIGVGLLWFLVWVVRQRI